MEIIEKQVEKVKEVPTDGYYGYGRRDDSKSENKVVEYFREH